MEAGRRWLALAPEHRADTLILAPTHAICRQANDTVREGLAEEGVLRGRTLAVDRLVNRRLTRVQASDIRSYEPGDTIVFHRDVYGCRASDVCIVMGHDDGRVVLAHPDGERRFRPSGNASRYLGLYDTERIELRAGDRIRWTRNRKAPLARGSHPQAPDLVNGGEAEIVEIGYKRVRFRDGEREFSIALTDPQLRHLDHAYCSTVHSAQGRTARGAIAVLDAGGWVDPELFHVELSRVSEAFLLLTDDREALIERLDVVRHRRLTPRNRSESTCYHADRRPICGLNNIRAAQSSPHAGPCPSSAAFLFDKVPPWLPTVIARARLAYRSMGMGRGCLFAIRNSRIEIGSLSPLPCNLRHRPIARLVVRAALPRSPSSRNTMRLPFAVPITTSYQHRSRIRSGGAWRSPSRPRAPIQLT